MKKRKSYAFQRKIQFKEITEIPMTEKLKEVLNPETKIFRWKDYYIFLGESEKTETGNYRHVSVSHKTQYPFWDDLKYIRDFFFDEDSVVVQVMPGKKKWLSLHPNCFHLYESLDVPYKLPDKDAKIEKEIKTCRLGDYV